MELHTLGLRLALDSNVPEGLVVGRFRKRNADFMEKKKAGNWSSRDARVDFLTKCSCGYLRLYLECTGKRDTRGRWL